MPRKKKTYKPISMVCLHCQVKRDFKGRIYDSTGKITCPGLAYHLQTSFACRTLYKEESLLYPDPKNPGSLCFTERSFLRNQLNGSFTKQRTSDGKTHTLTHSAFTPRIAANPAQLGLIPTGHSTNDANFHALLTSQTLYDPVQPFISLKNINGILGRERPAQVRFPTRDDVNAQPGSPTTNDDNADFSTEIDDSLDVSLVPEHIVPAPCRRLSHVSPHLSTKVELMNIMTQYQLPLCSFKSIFQWAMKSQKKPGFDFSKLYCA